MFSELNTLTTFTGFHCRWKIQEALMFQSSYNSSLSHAFRAMSEIQQLKCLDLITCHSEFQDSNPVTDSENASYGTKIGLLILIKADILQIL